MDTMNYLCPFCKADSKSSCDHLLVHLEYEFETIEEALEFYHDDTSEITDITVQQFMHDIHDWKSGKKLQSLLGDFFYESLSVIPHKWGGCALDDKFKPDLLHKYLSYATFTSNAIIRDVTSAVLDGFITNGGIRRSRYTLVINSDGKYIAIEKPTDLLDNRSLPIIFGISYWSEDNTIVNKLDDYLDLFFSFGHQIGLHTYLELNKALHDLFHTTKDTNGITVSVDKNIINELFWAFGDKSLLELKEGQIFGFDSESIFMPVPIEMELQSYGDFMHLLSYDTLLHERLREIWKSLTRIVPTDDSIKEIIEIEKEFGLLRKCVEELEKPLFDLGKEIEPFKDKPIEWEGKPSEKKLEILLKSGKIDRFLHDSLTYIYSLMCWQVHGRSDLERKKIRSGEAEKLFYILRECFIKSFLFLLPTSVYHMIHKQDQAK